MDDPVTAHTVISKVGGYSRFKAGRPKVFL